ncbi:MAG: glycosyltransferase family 4 protein [Nitrospirota bacterium]
MRKNILILDTGKEWGGGTNSLLELLKRIDRRNYKFTALFYCNCNKSDESDIKTEVEKLGIDFLLLDRDNQPASAKILKEFGRILLFFNRMLRKLWIFGVDYFFRIKKNAESITKLINDLNIDLIYMNNQPSTNLEGIIAAKNTGIKSLLHSRIEAELNFFEINAVNKWLTKMICVSEGVKDSFIKQGVNSSKCVVVHNGIDTTITPAVSPDKTRQELGIKDDEVLIGAVGSLVKRKRFDDLIEAISYLRTQNLPTGQTGTEHRTQTTDNPPIPPLLKGGEGGFLNKIKCIIVGEGPEREYLQGEIDKNKLNDRVILTGFKSDAISYINAMDIFILPSEREGFPRVILEAMFMEKPVIASRIAGPAELIINGQTGFLFQTGSIKEIAHCISILLSSAQSRREMGQTGKKRIIENFSIEKYIKQVSSVIAEVAG